MKSLPRAEMSIAIWMRDAGKGTTVTTRWIEPPVSVASRQMGALNFHAEECVRILD
jgi:hypothetical protein